MRKTPKIPVSYLQMGSRFPQRDNWESSSSCHRLSDRLHTITSPFPIRSCEMTEQLSSTFNSPPPSPPPPTTNSSPIPQHNYHRYHTNYHNNKQNYSSEIYSDNNRPSYELDEHYTFFDDPQHRSDNTIKTTFTMEVTSS